MARRPEHTAPPELFYNDDEAKKYTQNTRIIKIQSELTARCIEMCGIPRLDLTEDSGQDSEDEMGDGNSSMPVQLNPKMVLDIGCGSGLSGEQLTKHGHMWVGTDISKSMLDVACEREVEGDLLESDMGQGLPFRAGTFDAAISVSALQWLGNADKKVNKPAQRLKTFFESLYSCLKHGSKAVLQFYPENTEQHEFIWKSAAKAGFTGGTVIDFPNSAKRKKYYLVLFCGGSQEQQELPQGMMEEHEIQVQAKFNKKDKMGLKDLKKKLKKGEIGKKEWIAANKEKRKRQGKQVAADSKFTGRRRGPKF